MAPPDDQIAMGDLVNKATATASCLRKTVATETATFITSTSLQILPLAQRNSQWSPADMDVRTREQSFMNLMRFLILAFVNGHTNTVESTRGAIEEELRKTDEALVGKFTQLIQVWEMDKLAEDEEKRRPSNTLKSLSMPPEITMSPAYLDPTGQGRRGAVVAIKPTKYAKHTKQVPLAPSQAAQKLPILATKTADADAAAAATPSSRPTRNNNNNNNSSSSSTPSTHRHVLQQPRALADGFITQQQPSEANDFGIETRDGVLVGHPPAYPPALLDWEDPEDVEEMEELVSRRRARTGRRAGSCTSQQANSNAATLEGNGNEVGSDDDEWVCL